MTTSNVTSRIVVGLGLAVVFAVGLFIFATQTRQPPVMQTALNSAPPPAADPSTAGATTPAPDLATPSPEPASPPSAPPAAAAPVVSDAPLAAETKPAKAKKPARANREPSKPTDDATIPANAIAAVTSPDATPVTATPAPTTPAVDVPEGAAAVAAAPAASAPATAPVATDSQITASVKAELAAVAPESKVDVTTNEGVVSLIGQVASVDTIALARQAAERVPGVRAIDTAAMTVSNQ